MVGLIHYHDKDFQKIMNELNIEHGLIIEPVISTITEYNDDAIKSVCEFDDVAISYEQFVKETHVNPIDISDKHSPSRDVIQLVPGIYDTSVY